jgi:hypothetical protein
VPAECLARLLDALDHLRAARSTLPPEWLDALERDMCARDGDPVEVEAPRAVLRELLHLAIDETGERTAAACTSLLREGTSDELREELAALNALVGLLERLG